jgi:hypothetical protein
MDSLKISHEALCVAITELAHLYGYKVARFRPALTNKGWRTPVAGDGAGWPDMTIAKKDADGITKIIILEVKCGKDKPKPAQEAWLELLSKAPGVVVRVVRPEDWDETVLLLQG